MKDLPCDSCCSTADGRAFLHVLGLTLIGAGICCLILSATGKFLPHDEHFLGMTAADLCSVQECRIVHFMIHDRVSFGGAILAIGLLYVWLTAGPLRRGEPWAWRLFLLSGTVGFLSFFAYLGYGYLDTWHGLVTLVLFPCYVLGMCLSWRKLPDKGSMSCLLRPAVPFTLRTLAGWGRAFLLATSAGMIGAGLTIMIVGMTSIFVPQDLEFIGLKADAMDALNPRLLPLIAHDRAGFGGAVCTCGLTLLLVIWCARPGRQLWCLLALVGCVGFGTAVGIHPIIGYNDAVHLGPAVLGAIAYAVGLGLSWPSFCSRGPN